MFAVLLDCSFLGRATLDDAQVGQEFDEFQHRIVVCDPNSPHEGCFILASVHIKGALADASGSTTSTQHLVVLGLAGHSAAYKHIGIDSKLGVEASIFCWFEEQDAFFAVD